VREVGLRSTAVAVHSDEVDGGGQLLGRGQWWLLLRKRTVVACSKGGRVEVDGNGVTVLGLEEEDGGGALRGWSRDGGVL
jgi:hypothetical protein